MSSAWEKLAENRIQEAIENGELEPPPGGGPLDLTEYFALPEAERAGLSLLRNAGVIPPEIELLKAAAALERELAQCRNAGHAAHLREQLEEKRVAFALTLERRKRREPGA
jgi:hypothetical protein